MAAHPPIPPACPTHLWVSCHTTVCYLFYTHQDTCTGGSCTTTFTLCIYPFHCPTFPPLLHPTAHHHTPSITHIHTFTLPLQTLGSDGGLQIPMTSATVAARQPWGSYVTYRVTLCLCSTVPTWAAAPFALRPACGLRPCTAAPAANITDAFFATLLSTLPTPPSFCWTSLLAMPALGHLHLCTAYHLHLCLCLTMSVRCR